MRFYQNVRSRILFIVGKIKFVSWCVNKRQKKERIRIRTSNGNQQIICFILTQYIVRNDWLIPLIFLHFFLCVSIFGTACCSRVHFKCGQAFEVHPRLQILSSRKHVSIIFLRSSSTCTDFSSSFFFVRSFFKCICSFFFYIFFCSC